MTNLPPDPRDVALGLANHGARAGLAAGRVALGSVRVASRAPLVGGPLRRLGRDLAHQGALVRAQARARVEAEGQELLDAPELQRAADRLLSGPLTDAVAQSVAQHRVVERVASQIMATADLDGLITAILEDERTELVVERALASPGLERLVVHVLESQLADALTERVLASPELEHASWSTSPPARRCSRRSPVRRRASRTKMAAGVRRRTHVADDAAERKVRAWLHRPPRPQPS